jgi:uncharacterized membrane protein YqjE
MEEPPPTKPGIVASLRRLLSIAVAVGQNRLELFFVELREERLQFFELLLLAGIVILLATMTLAIITVAIVFLCLRAGRFDLLIGIIVLYVGSTAMAFWKLRQRLKHWEPFSATLGELKKDKACFAENK